MAKIILPKPTIVFLAGISGTGKTTLAKEIARETSDVYYLDKDLINDAFQSTFDYAKTNTLEAYKLKGPQHSVQEDYYHQNVKYQTHRALLAVSRENLQIGKSSIIQGLYRKEIALGYIDQVIFPFYQGIDHNFKILWCHADERVIRERMTKRNAGYDSFKLESDEAWKKFITEQPPLQPEIEKYDHRKIDTGKPLNVCVEQALDYLLK